MRTSLSSLRKLTYEAVRAMADAIILQRGATTTLEVKMALRAEGFLAYQRDISAMMDLLVQDAGWSYDCNGQYRTYYFAEDTDEAWANYLEDGQGRFWEVAVRGNGLYRSLGQVGKLGIHLQDQLPSNRHAHHLAQHYLSDRQAAGFIVTEDVRPPFAVRLPYWAYLGRTRLAVDFTYHYTGPTYVGVSDATPVAYQLSLAWYGLGMGTDFIALLSREAHDPREFPAQETSLRQVPCATGAGRSCPSAQLPRELLDRITVTYAGQRQLTVSRADFADEAAFLHRVRLLLAR